MVSQIAPLLPPNLQRILTEKGASSWLSVLPIEDHGFALHKGAFFDALCLRYGWLPEGLPFKCACGSGFTVDHAMNCSSGGFPTIRHNELRDFTATVLSEVCHDVAIEPVLQRLTGENLHYATVNVEDEGMRLIWMLVLGGFEVVDTREVFLMLENGMLAML